MFIDVQVKSQDNNIVNFMSMADKTIRKNHGKAILHKQVIIDKYITTGDDDLIIGIDLSSNAVINGDNNVIKQMIIVMVDNILSTM